MLWDSDLIWQILADFGDRILLFGRSFFYPTLKLTRLSSALKNKNKKHEYLKDYDNALDLMERPVRTSILIHLTIEALILTSLPHYATWKIFG